MKTSIITAAIILAGCFCAWSDIAAQPEGEDATPPATTSPMSSLLEIREPSQEDFEHCAKRAVDFFESIGDDQTQTSVALHELFGARELPSEFQGLSKDLSRLKSEITTFVRHELIAKKSYGENIIALSYYYHSPESPVYAHYTFVRTVDKYNNPLQWKCTRIHFALKVDEIIPLAL